jgi:hypothetical protein
MNLTFNHTVGGVVKTVTIKDYTINVVQENAVVSLCWQDDWGCEVDQKVEVSIADMAAEFPLDAATQTKLTDASDAALTAFFA